ncbi:glycosyl transferase [Idiomarina sp. OT37-5b]|jgi:glycosyl transferase family 25|uniref:glycosyltransferase family 25 protein n=1 Tax=Idiomarina sp. OT37-5b TaxID=2100422 RepID=UPI000CF9A3C8|nr:glycosyltransferase family 25 protein [Idiomarina sp. OT37-5b]AVJ55208.1 glycosyl transferase [Idiomarina sp. OT37-5b]
MMLPVYVINLDRSRERLQHASQQLHSIGVDFTRIAAIDGRQLSDAEIDRVYDSERNRQRFYASLTRGEIACYMSHRKAWQQLLDSPAQAAVILEDDIMVSPAFAELGAAVATLSDDWHLLKLAQPFKPKQHYKLADVGAFTLVDYRTDKPPMGACGYILSRSGAAKLLARKRFFRPVDVDFQWQWETGCYVQGLLPYCVDNTHQHGSDILDVEDRHLKDKSAWRRFLEQWRFYWQNRRFCRTRD